MTRSGTWVAAVDLGASSVRVCTCDIESEPLDYQIVHRVRHRPKRGPDRVLRWDWPTITKAVIDGLSEATRLRTIASIGVDAWAVDYGLVDREGELLANPASYRDSRTDNYSTLVERIGLNRLWAINGLQSLPINTIFQLHAEPSEMLAQAAHILTLPELLIHQLTGAVVAETTSAGSTGLVDQTSRDWSGELLEYLDLRAEVFPRIDEPGTRVGSWKNVPVHLVAGHDTAAAVVGIKTNGEAPWFISSGTWLLAGIELASPVMTVAAQAAGFTNEYGPDRTSRFLKNISGFWILEECRRQWGGCSTSDLLSQAALVTPPDEVFDATDSRFFAPVDMETEVLEAVGLPDTTQRATTVAIIVNSIAATAAQVLREAAELAGTPVRPIHLVGGGTRSPQFVDRLALHAGADVKVGAGESAVLGNTIIQGIALGRWSDVHQGRRSLAS